VTTWTTTDKLKAIRETLADALEAEADLRRAGALSYAREMALMAVTCREQIARLEAEMPRRRLFAAGRIPARNAITTTGEVK
jgi:hypothetical protein